MNSASAQTSVASAATGSSPVAVGAMPVRRLIRRRISRTYLGKHGWTPDPSEAVSFRDVLEATQVCTQQDLKDVDLVLQPCVTGTDLFRISIR